MRADQHGSKPSEQQRTDSQATATTFSLQDFSTGSFSANLRDFGQPSSGIAPPPRVKARLGPDWYSMTDDEPEKVYVTVGVFGDSGHGVSAGVVDARLCERE